MKPPFICHEILSPEGLEQLKPQWETLFQDSAYASPFASWDYVSAWWQEFGACRPGRQDCPTILILVVTSLSDSAPIGLFPYHFPQARLFSLKTQGLRPVGVLGQRYAALTEEPTALLRAGFERQAIEAVLLHLKKSLWKRHLDFFQIQVLLPEADTLTAPFLQKWQAKLQRRQEIESFSRMLPGSWEEMRRSLSRSMRDNITYYPRLLTRHGHSWLWRVVTSPDEMEAAAGTLVDLHRLRAGSTRGTRHTDHLPSAVHRHFMQQCLSRFAAKNQAAIWLLEVAGEPVAAQAVLKTPGAVHLYYSGFDPEWHPYSPLTILHTQIIKQAIADGTRRLNFLRLKRQWKDRWGAVPDLLFQQLIYIRPHPWSVLRTAVYAADRRSRDEQEMGSE